MYYTPNFSVFVTCFVQTVKAMQVNTYDVIKINEMEFANLISFLTENMIKCLFHAHGKCV